MVDDHDCRKTTVAASVGDHVDGVSSSARGGGSGSTTLSVDPISMLNGLLTGLQEGTMLPPSEADVQAALDLCDKLSAHLRGLLPSQKAIGESTSSMTEPLMMTSSTVVGGSSTCATSESDSDAPMHSSKCRPSAKARARLRRQRQEQQHEQQHEQYEQHEQHEQQVADQGNADQQPQWQEWQWQWQDPSTHQAAHPMANLAEQQEQFCASLWGGGWLMVPLAPMPLVPQPSQPLASLHPPTWASSQHQQHQHQHQQQRKLRKGRAKEPAPPRLRVPTSETSFQQQMWSGGWQMVPRASRMYSLQEEGGAADGYGGEDSKEADAGEGDGGAGGREAGGGGGGGGGDGGGGAATRAGDGDATHGGVPLRQSPNTRRAEEEAAAAGASAGAPSATSSSSPAAEPTAEIEIFEATAEGSTHGAAKEAEKKVRDGEEDSSEA